MTIYTLVSRYCLFALMAIVANLATQRMVLWFDDNNVFFILAVGAGTLVGLVLKYFLDKRWIFEDMSSGLKMHGKKFYLYTAMGIITTALFWCTETAFWYIWKTDIMREIGAVFGLTVGYIVKYNLDRQYVFTDAKLVSTS